MVCGLFKDAEVVAVDMPFPGRSNTMVTRQKPAGRSLTAAVSRIAGITK